MDKVRCQTLSKKRTVDAVAWPVGWTIERNLLDEDDGWTSNLSPASFTVKITHFCCMVVPPKRPTGFAQTAHT